MRLNLEIWLNRLAHLFDDYVRALVGADWNIVERQVRQGDHQLIDCRLRLSCFCLDLLDAFTDVPHLRDLLGRGLLLRCPDRLAHLVAPGAELVAIGDQASPPHIDLDDPVERRVFATRYESLAHAICVFYYLLNTEH